VIVRSLGAILGIKSGRLHLTGKRSSDNRDGDDALEVGSAERVDWSDWINSANVRRSIDALIDAQ